MNNLQLFEEIDTACSPSCKFIEDPNNLINDIDRFTLKGKSNLNIISMNIRSVNKNLDNFLVYINRLKTNIHLIVLSECWCDGNSIPPILDGYSLHYSKKSFNQNDGVIMYINDTITATVQENELNEANCLAAKIGNMTVFGIYRPYTFKNPGNLLDSLDTLLLTTRSRNIVLTGNININTLDTNNYHTRDYLEIIGSHGLQNAVDIATHGNTCLDHFICKLVGQFKTYVLLSDITDHYPLFLSISTSLVQKSLVNYSLTRTKINYESIQNAINNHDWTIYLATKDPELASLVAKYIEQLHSPKEKDRLSHGLQ